MPNPKLETYKNKATGTVYDYTDAAAQAALAGILDGTDIGSFEDVETALATKVDKVTGKGLSTNDYDNTAKGIVDNIQSNVIANTKLIKDTVGWSGKNKLVYPYVGTTYTANGVTYNVQSDGSIKITASAVTGATSFTVQSRTASPIYLPIGKYKISLGCNNDKISIDCRTTYNGNSKALSAVATGANEIEFEITANTQSDYKLADGSVLCGVFVGTSLTSGTYNDTVYPMLRDADILDDTYEPYHESVDIDKISWADAGKSVQKNKLNPNLGTIVNAGITAVVTANSITSLSGTSTGDPANILISKRMKWSQDKFVITCNKKTSTAIRISMYLYKDGTKVADPAIYINGNDYARHTIDISSYDYDSMEIRMLFSNGMVVSETDLQIMIINESVLDNTYVPYIPDNTELLPRSEQEVLGAKNLAYANQPSDTVKTVVCTVGADKSSVTLNGSPDSGNMAFPYYIGTFPKGSYIISGGDFTAHGVRVHIRWNDSSAGLDAISTDGDVAFSISDDTKTAVIYVYLNSGFTASNLVVKPMIRLSTDTDANWVPHAMTNRELTEKVWIKRAIEGTENLNDITDYGVYSVKDSPTNAPESASYCTLIVTPSSTIGGGAIIQTIIRHTAIYTRARAGNPLTWTAWYKYAGSIVS